MSVHMFFISLHHGGTAVKLGEKESIVFISVMSVCAVSVETVQSGDKSGDFTRIYSFQQCLKCPISCCKTC